jgi:O-antigen ligase
VTLALTGGTDATGAAYTIAFISFYTILVLQHSLQDGKSFSSWALFITFLVLVATETRAAILAIRLFSLACWW